MKLNVEEYMRVQDFLHKLQQLIEEERLIVFDEDTKTLKSVSSWVWNGPSIQINTENWEEEDAV